MNVLHQPPSPSLILSSWIILSHHCTSPPLPLSLGKVCQRESGLVKDIVECLWQAESHSNGSIMSLIMVSVSIIYQSWGPSDAQSSQRWLQQRLASHDGLSFPVIGQGQSRRWRSSKPASLPVGQTLGDVPEPDLLIVEHWPGKSHMTACPHRPLGGSAATLPALKWRAGWPHDAWGIHVNCISPSPSELNLCVVAAYLRNSLWLITRQGFRTDPRPPPVGLPLKTQLATNINAQK